MVSSLQVQATYIAGLASQMSKLIQSSVKIFASQPMDPLSRFSSLAQGLWGTLPMAIVLVLTQPSVGDLPPNLVQMVRNLQLQVKDLSTKFASVSAEKGNCCVRFGKAGFWNPCNILPLIQDQMPMSYFCCFVNGAILFKWILAGQNSCGDTLKSMRCIC
jgi:hypothetical protein